MTSILTAQPVTFLPNNLPVQMDSPQIAPASDRGAAYNPKPETDDKTRGRRRGRDKIKDEAGDISPGEGDGEGDGEGEGEGEGADGPSSGNDGPSRKRRRSRKGLDKKFECPQEGCGKSYSRAEHL
jgi:hypothetical protein